MSDVSVEDFLEHHGIKGMKWGVRRERPGGSGGSGGSAPSHHGDAGVIAKKTFQSLAVVGASRAGSIVGGSAGTVVLGPIVGSMAGGFVGGRYAGKAASRVVYGDVKAKKTAAKQNLSATLPHRNKDYLDGAAKHDIDQFGPDGAQRINKSMNDGLSIKDARAHEQKLQRTVQYLTIGASVATSLATNKTVNRAVRSGNAKAREKAFNYASQKGASRAAARTMADTRGLRGMPTKITKPGRNGVYKVTTAKR